MDPQTRHALYRFYREEFERHIEHLMASGVLADEVRARVDPACRRFLAGLDHVCCHSEFPAMAEVLLRNFELLTQLGPPDARSSH